MFRAYLSAAVAALLSGDAGHGHKPHRRVPVPEPKPSLRVGGKLAKRLNKQAAANARAETERQARAADAPSVALYKRFLERAENRKLARRGKGVVWSPEYRTFIAR